MQEYYHGEVSVLDFNGTRVELRRGPQIGDLGLKSCKRGVAVVGRILC